MNKEQELQILDQLLSSLKSQKVQRGFLLLEGQRIVSLCRDNAILPSTLMDTVSQRLGTLEELQSEMMEEINALYPDWDHQNNLDSLKALIKERKKDLTKRDRYLKTMEDISSIVFDSYDHNLLFKEGTDGLSDLNIDAMSDEECERVLGKYVMFFEALRENSASKQAEWVVKLSTMFDMSLIANILAQSQNLWDLGFRT